MLNLQAPPPFVGGTVPKSNAKKAEDLVLGTDVSDLQARHWLLQFCALRNTCFETTAAVFGNTGEVAALGSVKCLLLLVVVAALRL